MDGSLKRQSNGLFILGAIFFLLVFAWITAGEVLSRVTARGHTETTYDFVLFWHIAISIVTYRVLIKRHTAGDDDGNASAVRKVLPWFHVYPVACVLIVFLPNHGWDELAAHRLTAILVYFPLLTAMLVPVYGRYVRGARKDLSDTPIWIAVVAAAVCPLVGHFSMLIILLTAEVIILLDSFRIAMSFWCTRKSS